MLTYGKEMLYRDRLYDVDARFDQLQSATKAQVEEAIDFAFSGKNGKKAVALVGNTDKPFEL